MEYEWNFGLKFHLSYHKTIYWNPSMRKFLLFNELVILVNSISMGKIIK